MVDFNSEDPCVAVDCGESGYAVGIFLSSGFVILDCGESGYAVGVFLSSGFVILDCGESGYELASSSHQGL